VPATEFYDYQAKYFRNDSSTTAERPRRTRRGGAAGRRARDLRVTDCCGWGRVDFMRERRTANSFSSRSTPAAGMTDHSLVPMAARQAGIDFEELVWRCSSRVSFE